MSTIRTERLLVNLLIEEYGEDEATWRDLGSARRIARAMTAALTSTHPRPETPEHVHTQQEEQ